VIHRRYLQVDLNAKQSSARCQSAKPADTSNHLAIPIFPSAGLGDQIGSGRERVEQFGAPRQMAIKAMQKQVPKDTLPGKFARARCGDGLCQSLEMS
jgi:hypothetical protein